VTVQQSNSQVIVQQGDGQQTVTCSQTNTVRTSA
jgi:hypothetical protein